MKLVIIFLLLLPNIIQKPLPKDHSHKFTDLRMKLVEITYIGSDGRIEYSNLESRTEIIDVGYVLYIDQKHSIIAEFHEKDGDTFKMTLIHLSDVKPKQKAILTYCHVCYGLVFLRLVDEKFLKEM